MKYFLYFLSSLIFLSCTYVQKINDGATAFERKQFALALKMLPKEYQEEKTQLAKGKIAFMLAQSHVKTLQNEEAIEWFKTAYDNGYGIEALRGYANSLKKAERYDEAKAAYKELGIELGSPYEFRKDISSCEIATGWKENVNNNPYKITPAAFNSSQSEYAPSVYKDGSIIYTSDKGSIAENEKYMWTGNRYSDLFTNASENSDLDSILQMINTPQNNEGTFAMNKESNMLVFSRCSGEEREDHYCKLFYSQKLNDDWTKPKAVEFTKALINYGHPTFHPSGNIIFFSSNDPDGWGGYDIYASELGEEGWKEPRLLGRSINTEADEKFPFLDGDTLYFASSGHTGMGGLDVFKTYLQKGKKWSSVKNLLPPINSGHDDFAFVLDKINNKESGVLQQGYFASSRPLGQGMDDIYSFTKIVPPPPVKPKKEVVKKEEPKKKVEHKILLEVFVVENILQNANDPNSKVLGRRPISSPNLDVKAGSVGKTEKGAKEKNGSFTIELKEETDYYFFASKENYLNKNSSFSTKGIGKDPKNPIQKFELEIVLDKIFKDREIVIDNIYYDYDKAFIRQDAELALDKVYTMLTQNPQIKVQLSSHTDCRGKTDYNMDLSQRRAQSAIEYLIKKGIETSRLSARGYGSTLLAIDCECSKCDDSEHQANRRTTFKVLEY